MQEHPAKGMFIGADMQKAIMPAYRQQTVRTELFSRNQIIKEGEFFESAFQNGQPIYWTGDATVVRVDTESREEAPQAAGTGSYVYRRPPRPKITRSGQYAMQFEGRPVRSIEEAKSRVNTPQEFIYREEDMTLDVSFGYKVNSVQGFFKLDVLLYYEIMVGSKSLNVEPLQWQSGIVRNQIFVGIDDFDQWKTFRVQTPVLESVANQIPGFPQADGGPFSIRFYQLVAYDPSLVPEFGGRHRPRATSTAHALLQIDNVSCQLLYKGGQPRTEDASTYVNNQDYTLIPDEFVTSKGDVPEYKNRELIYPYAWRLKLPDLSPKLTTYWQRQGYPESVKLVDLLLLAVVDAAREPSVMITGTIDHNFDPTNYVRIDYYGNRIFRVNGYRWDTRKRRVEVELLEVLGSGAIDANFILMEDYSLVYAELNENNELLPIPME
jgi:hypothetical protein